MKNNVSAARPVLRYRDAGVSIDEADRAVGYIRGLAKSTFSPAVLTGIGSFGGGFHLKGWKDPVLVSSIDGVGTKLKVAFLTGKHDTVGADLVNHCVNDIAVQGATPLFFLDYFGIGKLQAEVARDVIAGMARACKENKCALIGGETAEMPGMYADGEYDLAGCIIGAVEKKKLITGASIQPGDVVLGLPSNGLHTNGYSLARKLLFEVGGYSADSYVDELSCTVGEQLLKVHRSYLAPIHALHKAGLLKAAAHITGGGITDNLPRVLPKNVRAQIRIGSWNELPVFQLLKRLGNMPDDDYRRTFNCGIGMILVVGKSKLKDALRILKRLKESPCEIGVIAAGNSRKRVVYSR
ncbi:MAG: phosphoribosylformylglycinamidine cyclo-ligase [Candidatus Solibacter usitatus]|nr:phosphoribosylformylglycinamidine cyclo-ligase [Candidatus Solibacter usitatus]